MRALLTMLWALPFTLLGLLVAFVGLAAYSRREGPAFLFVAPRGWMLGWFFRVFHMAAFTWGRVVIVREAAYLGARRLIRHEVAHVGQAAKWGPLFPAAYLLASLWALVTGQGWYVGNVFEVAARAAE